MAALPKSNLFDRYAGYDRNIVVAVSGGGDSMALLDLFRQAHDQNPKLPAPFVVTVDHGLREGFAREAAIVEGYCAHHRLPWKLVGWEGEKPKTGIMAAGRMARYGLLADAAHGFSASIILTGHTLDDQNETLAMRAARGLASAMDSDVLFERRALISRPLLEMSRVELRAYLAENTIAFADDPTNWDMRFERARMREQNHAASPVPADPALREDLIARAAGFILQNVKREGNAILILRPQLRDKVAEVFALRYLAATLGGFAYPAPVGIGARLFDLLNIGQRSVAFTAQRCRYMRVEGGISAKLEARHAAQTWLNNRVAPFESFCGYSLLALANSLAETLGAPRFILPELAAI
jgi:tRNA(Ile)-lysidine synthetase-like protein